MDLDSQLIFALNQYKNARLRKGDLLEDIMDSLDEIFDKTIDNWCDSMPV